MVAHTCNSSGSKMEMETGRLLELRGQLASLACVIRLQLLMRDLVSDEKRKALLSWFRRGTGDLVKGHIASP